ncbi:hypothetical protein [Acinetobacter bereziniae]|uniref:hypothetical protein n=1 Tax=Acinetobacter bereziniae TaxID=106648 RepID=UPI00124FA811|nr:hypothetical protein [Acinetobacter bereziniae]
MDNIIKFSKNQFDSKNSTDDVIWEEVSIVIDRDFTNAGFSSHSNSFKEEFKPIFESLFIGELRFPDISPSDDDPTHQVWRDAIEYTKTRISEHAKQLLSSTYERELTRYCQLYLA